MKFDSFSFAARPFSMREKVAEGRMRGGGAMKLQHFPLTLTLSLMERGRKTILAANQNESGNEKGCATYVWQTLFDSSGCSCENASNHHIHIPVLIYLIFRTIFCISSVTP